MDFSWLPGDRRGFRNRAHRIHSSGDYKHPPPDKEHKGLLHYQKQRSGKPVDLAINLRILVLAEFTQKMRSLGFRIIACSVGKRHLHSLALLPNNYAEIKRDVGKCKQKASHAVRQLLPGTIWSAGGEYERIKDAGHMRNTYDYIRTKQEPGTAVWSHRDDEDWIDRPEVGVIVMGRGRKHIRVFGIPQTPASEVF